SRYGWGQDNYLNEVNTGKGLKLKRWMLPYFRYVLPVLIIIVFIQGLIG
ncbi:MAG TPA: sodium-dependent transporter, partial [Erysipelotrichaceae bacterium]|nr:sodium-dependent transporter [Erysipelotrichaceae bacterium]